MSRPTKYQRWWMEKLAKGGILFEMFRGNDFAFVENDLEFVCWRSFNVVQAKGWVTRKYHRSIGEWYLDLTPLGRRALEE